MLRRGSALELVGQGSAPPLLPVPPAVEVAGTGPPPPPPCVVLRQSSLEDEDSADLPSDLEASEVALSMGHEAVDDIPPPPLMRRRSSPEVVDASPPFPVPSDGDADADNFFDSDDDDVPRNAAAGSSRAGESSGGVDEIIE